MMWTQDNVFLFLSVNLGVAVKNSTREKIANIGIRAMKFETARIHFLGDVFAAVAKAP